MPRRFAPRNDLAAFTMAEVLITLGVIGVVAALTLPSLITNIQNKGFTERLIKLYSAIGQATLSVSQEFGEEPKNWTFTNYLTDKDGSASNLKIVSLYQKYLKAVIVCGYFECVLDNKEYSFLNGASDPRPFYSAYLLYHAVNLIKLADGSTIGILFDENSHAIYWPLVHKGYKILYIVDVNGDKKPNRIGRDIFFLVLDKNTGKVMPHSVDDTSDCTTSDKGESCAAKIISEGKMNY